MVLIYRSKPESNRRKRIGRRRRRRRRKEEKEEDKKIALRGFVRTPKPPLATGLIRGAYRGDARVICSTHCVGLRGNHNRGFSPLCCTPCRSVQCSSWYLLALLQPCGPVGSDVRVALAKLCFILPRNGRFCSFVSFLLLLTGSAKILPANFTKA